jgi:hypothetical protein
VVSAETVELRGVLPGRWPAGPVDSNRPDQQEGLDGNEREHYRVVTALTPKNGLPQREGCPLIALRARPGARLPEAPPGLSSGGGQEESHPEADQEDQDGASHEAHQHGLVLHGLARHSIHCASPPACSITPLASADASWHRSQAATDAGGSNTMAGRFIRTFAIVAVSSSSTSVTRRRVRWVVAAGRRTM